MSTDGIIRRNPQVVYRELAGEGGAVLLHLDSGAYHGLNPTGVLIWSLIDDERTFAELVAAVRDRLEDPPEDLDAETERFLADLRARDLIAS